MPEKKGLEGCDVCGRELLLFKCPYCSKAFCEQHKVPEKHDCTGMAEYRQQQAAGALARPGGATDGVEKGDVPAEPSQMMRAYKRGVLAVKVLSVIAVTAACVLAFILLLSYVNVLTPTWSYSLPVTNSTGAAVMLTNYRNATDPTWDNLTAFLNADDTIQIRYDYPNFTCADFSRTLHDRAEAAGIACGFVAVDFDDRAINYTIYDNGDGTFSPPTPSPDTGHGLNVFRTTDRGLVYVDASSQSDFVSDEPAVRIAYLEEGQELNEIDLGWAINIHYPFYESYKLLQLSLIADQRAYYKDRMAYDAKLSANNNIMTPELKVENEQLNARAEELNARKSRIGPFYYPIGIVKKVDTYW